jgi:hypothetical protein
MLACDLRMNGAQMTTAFERLKAIALAAATPLSSLERRIAAETGLPVVWDAAPDPIADAVARHLIASTRAGHPEDLAQAFDQHFAARTLCGNGYRTYRIVQDVMMRPIETAAMAADPAIIVAGLKPYADWWRQDRSNAAAAGAYARALTTAGYALVGGATAAAAAPVMLASLRDTCAEARSVLAYAARDGRRHWLWRQADFVLTFVAWNAGCEEGDALLPSFAAVQTLDSHEFGIYDDRAVHLLPRWSGGVGAVDAFARAAADRTAAQFGELLYARIYDNVLGFEDPEATHIDVDRFLRGFADWQQRFPGQPLVNRYAAHAHAFGRDAVVTELFRTSLREVHPSHWFAHQQPLEAWRAAGRNAKARWA